MKVLDVSPFHEGIQRTITMLARLEAEIQTIERTVEGLIAMEDSLKGEGGNAIRAFYAECHVPFLQFFLTFQSDFKSTLERMDNALDTLEPNPSGFIRESFLEREVEEGLEAIAKLTERLTNEANNIMDGVSDIVALPHLDDSDVQAGVGDAKIKRNDTVTQLNEFDATQTTALAPVETDLTTMMTWISDIESLFTDGVTDIDFPRDQWAALSAKNSLKTELAHRTGTMAGVNGMTDVNGQPGMMLGVGASDGNAVLSPQGFGDDPGTLYGSGAYSLPGMATQASPLHDAGISRATMLASSAVISSGTKPAAAKVTSTPAAKVEKPKKKNKVFGFLKDAADFLILDDVKTVVDPNASLWDKGVAIFSATPTGKAVKAGRLGVKLVKDTPFGKSVVKKVNNIFEPKTKWQATRSKGTQQTYEVYKRNDINWEQVRDGGDKRFIGKTNKEAADRGLPPQLSDGNFATLHHVGQDSRGPLAEASTRYHGVGKYGQDILHSQFGKNKPNPNYPIDRKRFNVDTREYWQTRTKN